MFAQSISITLFETVVFYQNGSKITLFLQKNAKFSSAVPSAVGTPGFPAAGGLAIRPTASSGKGLCPQVPNSLRRLDATPPDPQNSTLHCEFLAARLTVVYFSANF